MTSAAIGHNSGQRPGAQVAEGGSAARDRAADARLRLLIERVERLEEEKQGLAEDIRDVYAEAKAVGYDAKIMRQVVRLRKMDPQKRHEEEMILDTYRVAVGLDGPPTEPPAEPAVPLRASVKWDYLVCLDCGERVTDLSGHICDVHWLTPEDYRALWQLPRDYPMLAPAEDERREAAAGRR